MAFTALVISLFKAVLKGAQEGRGNVKHWKNKKV